jgi:putative FmdB family regulatory protein
MPIYEFRCECGHQFEKLCKVNDKQTFPCPQCKGEARRVMSTFRKIGSSTSFGESYASGSSCSSCTSHNCSACH